MHSPIYKTFDIVIVPFPFVDADATKNRPALVVSSRDFNQHGNTVLMMITSAQQSAWPLDTPISQLNSTGLTKESIIRAKLFTIDNRLIKTTIGKLSPIDQKKMLHNFTNLFEECFTNISH